MYTDVLLFIDSEWLARNGGMWVAMLLVFSTTGLFFCFFLPSGAVLFGVGVLVAAGTFQYSFFSATALLVLATVAGGITAYWFGRKTGTMLYSRPDSRLFRKQHLKSAESFYNKYGWLVLTAGLFLPIIRTFAPIVAGIVRMDFSRFLILSFCGAVVWVSSFVAAGYFIATRPLLKPWLKCIVPAFILLVIVPLIIRTVRELKRLRKSGAE